jgi:HAD superfamily hydrolase (TIGR01509 family)
MADSWLYFRRSRRPPISIPFPYFEGALVRQTLSDFAAVIFDMDGLMIDTEPIYRRSWQRAAAECGFHISDEFYLDLIGRTKADAIARVTDAFGDAVPTAKFHDAVVFHETRGFAEETLRLKPGVFEALDLVDAAGTPKAVATATRRAAAEARLTATELRSRFHILVTGDQVANGKPAPDIFFAAAAALGVRPERCLVLEDSEPGVTAAAAAGMTVFMVPDLKPPSVAVHGLAHRIFPSLFAVADALAGRTR